MPPSCAIIVPARGGSKRVPRKNLALLARKPLLEHTLEQIDDAGVKNSAWISTEDAEIAALAKTHGFAVLDRPAPIANDHASTEAVLIHALDALEAQGKTFDWVMTLPPTSPLRTAETIRTFLEKIPHVEKDIDCLFAVTEKLGRFWKVDDAGAWHQVFPNAPSSQHDRREQGLVLYEENSAVYLTRVSALRKAYAMQHVSPIFGEKKLGVVIPEREAMDINTLFDLELIEKMLLHPHHRP